MNEAVATIQELRRRAAERASQAETEDQATSSPSRPTTGNPTLDALRERARQRASDPFSQFEATRRPREHPEARTVRPGPGTFGDVVLHGMTFGGSDEAMGLAAGLTSLARGGEYGPAYRGARDRMRERYQDYRERYPERALIGEALGSVPTAAALPMGGVMRGTTAAGQVVRGGASGVGAGGTYGFASGEGGVANRVGNAVPDAIAGGVVGAAIPGAAAVGTAAARNVHDVVRPNALAREGVGRRAQAGIFRSLENDDLGVSDAMRIASEYGRDAMPADVSPGMRQHADVLVANNRPGAREYLRRPLDERREGSREAAGAMFDDVLGPQPDLPQLERSLKARQRANADRNYEVARQANAGRPVNTSGVLQRIADDIETDVEALMTGARMRDLPEEAVAREMFKRLTTDGRGQIVDFDRLSRVQQVVYRRAQGLLKSSDGNQRLAGGQLMRYHDMLVEALDEVSEGLYSQARGHYRDDAAVSDALERGLRALDAGEHPQRLAEYAAQLPAPAQEALRAGVRDNVRRMLSSSRGDVSLVRELSTRGTRVRANLEAILGPDEAERVARRARGEYEKRLTEGIGRGSQTQPRQDHHAAPQRRGRVPLDAGVTGLALRGAQEALLPLIPDLGAGTARQQARFLGAQGSDRDRLLQLLLDAETQRNRAMPPSRRALVDALLSTQLPAAIAGSGTPRDTMELLSR